MPTEQRAPCESEPHGVCPSCGAETDFKYIGIQHWPEEVAKRLGFPPQQVLWQCRHCNTTLAEASLELEDCA